MTGRRSQVRKADVAHHQTKDRNPKFRATIPMADMRSSRASRSSNEFIAIIAVVCTNAHHAGCQPAMAQAPRTNSSTPMVFVAMFALPVPRIFPTIKR